MLPEIPLPNIMGQPNRKCKHQSKTVGLHAQPARGSLRMAGTSPRRLAGRGGCRQSLFNGTEGDSTFGNPLLAGGPVVAFRCFGLLVVIRIADVLSSRAGRRRQHLVQGLAVVCQDGVDFESHLAVWQSRAFRNDSSGVRRTEPTGEFVRVINKIWPSLLADQMNSAWPSCLGTCADCTIISRCAALSEIAAASSMPSHPRKWRRRHPISEPAACALRFLVAMPDHQSIFNNTIVLRNQRRRSRTKDQQHEV